MSVENYIKSNVRKVCEDTYIVPKISESKMNSAIFNIAPTADADHILAIIDSSVLKNGKEGIVFTGDTVYMRYSLEKRREFKFEDISMVKYGIVSTGNGNADKKQHLYFYMKDDSVIDITTFMAGIEYKALAEFLTGIINEAGEEKKFIVTTQMVPLVYMQNHIKENYIKLICNFAYSNRNQLDHMVYGEIISLLVRINYNRENSDTIRCYMCEEIEHESTDDLIDFLYNNVLEGSMDVVKMSLMKDIMCIYMINNKISKWKSNEFIMHIKDRFELNDEEIEFIVEVINSNRDIILEKKSDADIRIIKKQLFDKSEELVIRLSDIDNFSNKRRRVDILKLVNRNYQKTLEYLTEDMNEVSILLMKKVKKAQKQKKIEKLLLGLSIMSRGSYEISRKVNFLEREILICRVPKLLDVGRLIELTTEPTKYKFRKYILSCYEGYTIDEEQRTVTEVQSGKGVMLRGSLSLNELDRLHETFIEIGYTNIKDAAIATARGTAKSFFRSFF